MITYKLITGGNILPKGTTYHHFEDIKVYNDWGDEEVVRIFRAVIDGFPTRHTLSEDTLQKRSKDFKRRII